MLVVIIFYIFALVFTNTHKATHLQQFRNGLATDLLSYS